MKYQFERSKSKCQKGLEVIIKLNPTFSACPSPSYQSRDLGYSPPTF